MDDLARLVGAPCVVEVGARRIEIMPVRVRELPAFVRAVGPALGDLQRGVPIPDLLAAHAESLIDAVAVGARVERAWLDDQDADTLFALVEAVIEVNLDFFLARLAPRLAAVVDRWMARAGQMSACGSPAPASSGQR